MFIFGSQIQQVKSFGFIKLSCSEEVVAASKSYFFLLANKTGCKTIEDWVCPTAKLHPDTRKRSDISLNSDPHGSLKSGENLAEPNHHVVATVPLHLILIIIACILVVLVC